MVRVRPAVAADRSAIWALNGIPNIGSTADPSFPLVLRPYDEPPPQFPDLAEVPDTFTAAGGSFFVAEDDGRLVGMGGYKRRDPSEAQVLRVRVHPALRRRGIGRRLMAAIETAAAASGVRRLVLETADNQPEAIAFYEATGYRRTGTESNSDWTWTLLWFAKDIAQPGLHRGTPGAAPSMGPVLDVRDVTEQVRSEGLRPLLDELAWRGEPSEIDRIVARYEAGLARLYALFEDDEAVACVGLEPVDDAMELRSVATRADRRRRGHASHLINALVQQLDLVELRAETDADAVGFYRALGFGIESLGERYPGVVRYRCTRRYWNLT